LTILAGVDVTDMQKQKTKAAVIVCAILNDSPDNRTDKYEQEWNGFWHFYNAMQFLPGFAGVTENGMSAMIYNIIPSYSPDVEDANADSDTSEQWTEILEQVFDDEAKVYLNKLITIGVPSPSSVGYELVNSRGAVIAGCELAWEDKKIAFLLEEDAKDIFEREGWKVIMVNEDVDISAFEGGNN
jgi:DEAD/DEAH box helicase domain-containing protein